MGVRRFEDLVTWQLAHELEQEVFAFTAGSRARADVKFCAQIRESARSAPRNTAEGFGRYYPKEFSRFLRIAAGSLHETKNHLQHAHDRGYLSQADHERLTQLAIRCIRANSRLLRYLARCDPPEPFANQ
jgi:four helix bundle protein